MTSHRNSRHRKPRHGKSRWPLPMALLGLLLLSACHATTPNYGRGPAHVPPGHMPPPGQCRIWYPDTPPGHQPPPGPCYKLRHRVPPGAHLIYG